MFESSKLRPDTSIIGIMQPVIALVIFACIWGIYGMSYGLLSLSFIYGFYAILSLIYLIRTGNLWYIPPFVFQVTVIAITLLAPEVGLYAVPKANFKPLSFLLTVEMAVLIYIIINKKLKWRGWEVLELAARNVDDTTNGFTERPRPLGKIVANKYELAGFAAFLRSKLIAFVIEEENRYVIVPITTGNEYRLPLGISSDYSENTRIEIDLSGNVTAQISKKDYLRYKEALAFDQLVESMGNLFVEFFNLYKNGEETRIMYRISKVKTTPFN